MKIRLHLGESGFGGASLVFWRILECSLVCKGFSFCSGFWLCRRSVMQFYSRIFRCFKSMQWTGCLRIMV